MPDMWIINVGGRSYGPYALEQMRTFAAEGRLAPHSQVARAEGGELRAAADDPELAQLFRPAAAQPPRPVFFTAEGDLGQQGFGRQDGNTPSGEPNRFVIAADMKSHSIAGLEEEIFNLGVAYPIMPQAWIVSCNQPINKVRSTLVKKLGKLDTLFIVDATNDKAAWFNYGPEAETRIRRIWHKTPEPTRHMG